VHNLWTEYLTYENTHKENVGLVYVNSFFQPPPLNCNYATEGYLNNLLHPGDGGSMVLQNICILPHHYTASQPRRPWHECLSLWNPKSYNLFSCTKVIWLVATKSAMCLHILFHSALTHACTHLKVCNIERYSLLLCCKTALPPNHSSSSVHIHSKPIVYVTCPYHHTLNFTNLVVSVLLYLS